MLNIINLAKDLIKRNIKILTTLSNLMRQGKALTEMGFEPIII